MRIITVNLPVTYIKAIDNLIGENATFPSRSELVRVAVREFLIKELEAAQAFMKCAPVQNSIAVNRTTQPIEQINNDLFVRVPISTEIGAEMSYKTFRIVKK